MKKFVLFFAMTIAIISVSLSTYAANENVDAIINREISIVYNEELKAFADVTGTKVDPISYNDTTYLPVRAISALFNVPVDWDSVNNKVLVGKGTIVASTVKTIDKFEKGNSETINLLLNRDLIVEYRDVAQTFKDEKGNTVYPLSYNGTTYLPVRAIANMYGAEIAWNGEKQQITLSMDGKVAQITDVVIKVINDTLCTEIKTDWPIDKFNNYIVAEGTVTAEPYLNMRASASTSAEVVEKIPDKTQIAVKKLIKGENNVSWYEVTYLNKTGYVSSDYVEVISPRLLIDIENSMLASNISSQVINYEDIKSIRFGAQGNDVNRIVLDLNNVTEYSIFQSNDKLTTYLALAKDFEIKEDDELKDYVLVASAGNQIYLPETDKSEDGTGDVVSGDNDNSKDEVTSGDVTTEPSGDANENIDSGDNEVTEEKPEEKPIEEPKEDDELTEEQIKKMAKVTAILYSSTTNKTKINITGNYEFEKFMLDNPVRLVIDIEGALLQVDGPTEITPKNKVIEQIRFSQNEKDKVRVVFDLSNAADYEITQKTKGLEVEIVEPKYRNVKYVEYDDYAELILEDVKKSVFNTTESARTNKLTITYSSSRFDSGKATLEIEDDFVEEINIYTNKIIIDATSGMEFSMKQSGSDVVVTISKEAKKENGKSDGDFIILLDAGHGGKDPGACHNGGATVADLEKTYNLKIMLKLKELLEDTEGIEVRTSRTTDVYIDREGRIDYVLDNPDADMLVSIHINSLANKSYRGTMVLYYNKPCEREDYGITSKEIAELVKNNLVDDLDLIDRGVVSRNDLWVLEQNAAGKISEVAGEDRPVTNLPAILCELCFISNEEDFANLKTEEFQDGAALAIYNGIIEAKEQMGK